MTILVPSTLWTLTGFLPVGPGPHMELPCRRGAGMFPICLMQFFLALIFGGLMSDFSGIIVAFVSPLLRLFSFATKLALANFLEGQTVHRLLSVHGLWARRYYGTYSSWLD